jgi:hypothetical protein
VTDDLTTLLRDRLDREVARAPIAPSLSDVIATCERDLTRHRRRLTTASVVAVAAGVTIAVGVPALLGETATRSDHVAVNPSLVDPDVNLDGRDPAVLIEACREGAQSIEDTNLLFSAGEPRIVAYSHTLESSSVVLLSPDNSVWADCFNADKSREGANTVMSSYTAEPSSQASGSAGYSCPDQPDPSTCDDFIVDFVDRLPSEVAEVEYRTIDGVTTVVPVDRYGFAIFDYEGTAPEPYPGQDAIRSKRIHWVGQITYLGAAGDVLASNRYEETSGEPYVQPVPGVPELSAYPSLSLRPDRANSPWIR